MKAFAERFTKFLRARISAYVMVTLALLATLAAVVGAWPNLPRRQRGIAGVRGFLERRRQSPETTRSARSAGVRSLTLRGAMLLVQGPDAPVSDFLAQTSSRSLTVTRVSLAEGVWTDEKGEQVFSELKGEGTAAKNRITGTILGGTGRYAGITGSYEFSWQFVIEAEDGSIQGNAAGLKGPLPVGWGKVWPSGQSERGGEAKP